MKTSVVTGLSLAGIGVLVVVPLRLLSDYWPAPGLPNILIGLMAVGTAATHKTMTYVSHIRFVILKPPSQ